MPSGKRYIAACHGAGIRITMVAPGIDSPKSLVLLEQFNKIAASQSSACNSG